MSTLRRVLVRSAAIAVLVSLALPFRTPGPAFACSCAAPASPAAALGSAAAVFRGTVTSIDPVPGAVGSLGVQFKVDETWKGVVTAQARVRTPNNEAACGFAFRPGTAYLVYADPGDTDFVVLLCSRTVPLANAGADLAALGPGMPPQEVTPTPAGGPPINEPQPFPRRMAYVAAALVVVVLSLGGALIVWRRGAEPSDDEE